ncbi:hypothetical protein EDD85DRAFT_795810 [Armillaria nabsnona]|nr:hypothetical protein EDD85DRAFT_795810 [Armillaria nabsnona]
MLEHTQAKEIASDLQLISSCMKDLQDHPSFVTGSLVPTFLESATLFCHDFSSERQIRALISTAQISFCSGITFVNTWRMINGAGSDRSLLPRCMAFIKRLKLHMLPLQGGVFNLEQSFDCHILGHYLQNGGPAFLLYVSPNQSHKPRLAQCDHECFQLYHSFNDTNYPRLSRQLKVEEIPMLSPRLSRMCLTNEYLQFAQPLLLDKEQARLPETIVTYYILPGFSLIPIQSRCVWATMRLQFGYQVLKRKGDMGAGQVLFFSTHKVRYMEGSAAAEVASWALAKAEEEGILSLIRGIPERYASTLGPASSHPAFSMDFLFPYITAREAPSLSHEEDTEVMQSPGMDGRFPWVTESAITPSPGNLIRASWLIAEVKENVTSLRRKGRQPMPYP